MNDTYILSQQRELLDIVIKKSIEEAFTSLSLLADDLISSAEKETKTREEYIAYLKGAAYIFYKVCKRTDEKHGMYSSGEVNSPEEAIEHCIHLFPFMTKDEQREHLKLINWLNDLLEKSEKPKVVLPNYIKLV